MVSSLTAAAASLGTHLMASSLLPASLSLLSALSLPAPASGHGYLMSPRSRNYVAYEDGPGWIAPGDPDAESLPLKDYCPHCLNRGGICGVSPQGDGTDYDSPPNAAGGPMPLNVQRTYGQGEIIELETVLTAHHKGHFEFKACPLEKHGDVLTQTCFDEHELEFIEDVLYGAPKDPNHPTRAYVAPPTTNGALYGENPYGMIFRHRFKLPADLKGDVVILQWHYVTGNSCHDVGYDQYNFPWQTDNLATCSQPLPSDGLGAPEQFWNCAEISIVPDGLPSSPTSQPPTEATAPTPTPPSSTPPTTPTPSTMANMCGTSWMDAASKCGTPCPSGNATACPPGEYCYADVNVEACGESTLNPPTPAAPTPTPPAPTPTPPTSPTAALNKNYCGSNWVDANSKCTTACPGGMDSECPTGESCFADCDECSVAPGPTPASSSNCNYCGSNWIDANSKCTVACPGGENSECPVGEFCFADCTDCTGEPTAPTPTVPTPIQPTTARPTFSPVLPGACDTNRKMVVNMGYYQSWAIWRNEGCYPAQPSDIDVAGMQYTHLVYSFASISSSLTLEPWGGDYSGEVPQYTKFNALKTAHPGLKTSIAVGGWTHNNPNEQYCNRFSTVSSTAANRQAFADSVVNFLVQYDFDGIDFDWEYPVDASRCGVVADYDNYALLVEAVRDASVAAGHNFLITMAVPASPSRLDEGYNLLHLAQSLDWFNIMTYDIAGSWSPSVGSHTDMTFIKNSINYFLDKGVPSHQLVMGLGAYGRTFTLSDSICMDVGCPFSGAAGGGCPVWDEAGYTAYFTILETIQAGTYKKLELNTETGSMELVTNTNEFISFDNQETFQIKVDHASETCMRGYMWWAVDMIKESFTLQIDSAPTTQAPTTTSQPTSAPIQPTDAPTGAPVQPTDAPIGVPVQPTDAPTGAPVGSQPKEYTASQTPRCGTSELDAREFCRPTCVHNGDCLSGQWCWGVHLNYCDDPEFEPFNWINPTQSSVSHRCGKNEVDARVLCKTPCTSNLDCPTGEACYPVNMNYCGSDSTSRRHLRRN